MSQVATGAQWRRLECEMGLEAENVRLDKRRDAEGRGFGGLMTLKIVQAQRQFPERELVGDCWRLKFGLVERQGGREDFGLGNFGGFFGRG